MSRKSVRQVEVARPAIKGILGLTAADTMNNCASIAKFVGSALSEVEVFPFGNAEGYGVYVMMEAVAEALTLEAERYLGQCKTESSVQS